MTSLTSLLIAACGLLGGIVAWLWKRAELSETRDDLETARARLKGLEEQLRAEQFQHSEHMRRAEEAIRIHRVAQERAHAALREAATRVPGLARELDRSVFGREDDDDQPTPPARPSTLRGPPGSKTTK